MIGTHTKHNETCTKCNKEITRAADSIGTGYAVDSNGAKICYACCGVIDREALKTLNHGQAMTLYFNEKTKEVINWPSSLRIKVNYVKTGRHNWAGVRYDFWFMLDGQQFHGVRYGNNTEICHIKKLKKSA